MSAYTQEERDLYKLLAQIRKSRRLAAVIPMGTTPEQILASSSEWRRQVEEYAGVNKSSDTTWGIVACLLEPLDV
jgi:hypothetical protein